MTEGASGVEGGGEDPGALLIRAWIYQGLGLSPPERLLQLVPRKSEQPRNVRRVA